jgi:hypothetical protein
MAGSVSSGEIGGILKRVLRIDQRITERCTKKETLISTLTYLESILHTGTVNKAGSAHFSASGGLLESMRRSELESINRGIVGRICLVYSECK